VSLPALVYKVNSRDNVGTALSHLKEGVEYPVYEEGKGVIGAVKPNTPIPAWHKIALERIEEGGEVVKFGYIVGVAVTVVEEGVLVHVTNVLLDPTYDFRQMVRQGLVLGIAPVRVERGEVLRLGVNVRPLHPALRGLPPRSRVGMAACTIAENGTIRLGNIVEPPPRLRRNERYVRLVRDFYRMLRAGLIEFSRVEVG
jgi:hypothetical protein